MLATGTLMTSCGCCDELDEAPKMRALDPGAGDAGSAGVGPGEKGPDEANPRNVGTNGMDPGRVSELGNTDGARRPPIEPSHDPEATARQRAIEKARDFDSSFHDDVVVLDERMALLRQVYDRINRAQQTVGYGYFGLFGFDDLIGAGRRFSKVGKFETTEIRFLEELFGVAAADYGFFGEKVITELSHRHKRREVKWIRGAGHYLLIGHSLETFERMQEDVPSLVLTSGVRGLAKQYQLFLSKVVETEGNLSRAARSLAPPGYSYHGAGDFDVGAASLGEENFTDQFAATDEYRRLMDLGYVAIRYDLANELGVRHEPWHIRVA